MQVYTSCVWTKKVKPFSRLCFSCMQLSPQGSARDCLAWSNMWIVAVCMSGRTQVTCVHHTNEKQHFWKYIWKKKRCLQVTHESDFNGKLWQSHTFHYFPLNSAVVTVQWANEKRDSVSYPGLISGGFGKGFVKLVFPTSQYVSSIPLPCNKKNNSDLCSRSFSK